MTRASGVRRPVIVAMAMTGLLGLGSPALAAGGYSHPDPVGDQVSYSQSTHNDGTAPSGSGPTPAPEHRNGDIAMLWAHHGPRRVSVSLQMADFTPSPLVFAGDNGSVTTDRVVVLIRTRSGRQYVVIGGNDGASRGWQFGRVNGAHPQRCRGLRHSFDPGNSVSVSVPRRCLGRPRVVRVGAGTAVDENSTDPTTATDVTYLDDALRTGLAPEGLVLSPRLARSRH